MTLELELTCVTAARRKAKKKTGMFPGKVITQSDSDCEVLFYTLAGNEPWYLIVIAIL